MYPQTRGSRWLVHEIGREVAPVLYCLPGVGIGPAQFARWPRSVDGVEIRALQYPGDRDAAWWRRYPTIESRAVDLVDDLADRFDRAFALFGHGGSALVAYEAAVEAGRRGLRAPAALLVSDCAAPRSKRLATLEPSDEHLSEQALIACLETGGNPLPSLVEAGVRALRAESAALGVYDPPPPVALDVPITVVTWLGSPDVDLDAAEGWAECGPVEFLTFEGSRYRYADAPPELLRRIASIRNA
jgi:surfactin synthase thioesterase subunit